MKQTGAVERRVGRLHYELCCEECKRTKWVRSSQLKARSECADCAGAQGRRNSVQEDLRTGKWYVRMIGSAHTLPQWACGDPEAPCWTGGEKIQFVLNEPRDVPAAGARVFDTRIAAFCWIEKRKEYLDSLNKPVGQYAVVHF